MDFWLLRLRGREVHRGVPRRLPPRLKCAKCGAEISPEEAGYIRISGDKVVAYCMSCVFDDLKKMGIRVV
ncbi:MAG: hypothetical protein ABWJ97_06880 [Thermoproteus sp.]